MPGVTIRREEQYAEHNGASPLRPGIWTPYGPEPTAEERAQGKLQESYKIRLLSYKKITDLRKVSMDRKWVNHQQVEVENPERYNELLYDYLIEDWQGVYEDEAQTIPAPCTLENKVALMSQGMDRPNFVVLQGALYANDDDARREAERQSFRRTDQVSPRLSQSEV